MLIISSQHWKLPVFGGYHLKKYLPDSDIENKLK
jgi:hypothetical protein